MYRVAVILFSLLLFSVRLDAQNYCSVASLPSALQSSVMAYYPFCGNPNDVSGNNFTSTATNVTLSADRFGNSNSAYSFNGTNSRILSNITYFNPGWNNYAVSFWMSTSNTAKLYQSCVNTVPHNGLQLAYNFPGAQQDHVHFSVNTTPSVQTWDMTQYSQGTFTNIVNGQWNHVVLSRNGTVWKFYMNGTLDAVFSSTSSVTSTLIPLMFGAILNPTTGLHDQFFEGKLDDIIIYNRSLNSVEAQSLYCLVPSDPGPISGAVNACSGVQGTYSVSPVNGANSYSWVTPGNWTGTSTTNVIGATPGVGGVFQLEAVNVCGKSVPVTLTVNVNSAPTVTASTNTPTLCEGSNALLSAGGASTYVWNPGGGFGANVSVNPTVTTIYTVTGTMLGCSSTATLLQEVANCTPVGEFGYDPEIKIFPQPSQGKLWIENGSSESCLFLLTDVIGRKAEEFILSKGERRELNLISGIYLIKSGNNRTSVVRRIIVE